MRRCGPIVGALGMLASACAVGPNYVKPQIASPSAFADAASTQHTVITGQAADLSTWWTQFSDPVLDGLVKRALADNLDLQTAASRVREARAQVRVVAAVPLDPLSWEL